MTKGEGHAVLLLLFCTLLITFWPYRPRSESPSDFSRLMAMADNLKNRSAKDSVTNSKSRLFNFNPNLASTTQLSKLGFSKVLANRIVAYRSKVKRFEFKSDLYKIYGMDSTLVDHLYPYINLPVKQSVHEKENDYKHKAPIPVQKPIVELNSADTDQLKSLPCIGSKLANRIGVFRDKLGGFVSKDQLREVYGLDTNCLHDLYALTSINLNAVRTIRINTFEVEQLAQHPYIGKFLAKSIVAYRQQHGTFKQLEDLKKLKSLSNEKWLKLLPYLSFE